MTLEHFFLTAWDPEPSVFIGCALLILAYWKIGGFRRGSATPWLFLSSMLVLLLALVSPLDTLADHYLFCAHMLQHMILYEAVPTLFLLGLPAAPLRRLLQWEPASRVEQALRRPAVAWFIGIATLFVWHWPPLFDAAMTNEPLHIFQHLCFLIGGTIFWYPILTPLLEARTNVFNTITYLFLGCISTSVLGLLIATHAPGLYAFYDAPVDAYGILPALRGPVGLTVANDQQLGGFLMWAPCCLLYVAAIMAAITQWYMRDEEVPAAVAVAGAGR